MQKDFETGIFSENEILPILRNHFSENIEKIQDRYDVMDFKSDTSYYELKTRACKSHAYPDSMIGINKITFAQNSEKNVYFLFRFIDGIFYWKYDKNNEDQFRVATGGRSDRGRPEYASYAYINTKYFIKIENKEK